MPKKKAQEDIINSTKVTTLADQKERDLGTPFMLLYDWCGVLL